MTKTMMKTILWGMAAVAFCATIIYGFQTAGRRYSDFAGYYTASRILVSTDSISYMYDNDWFKEKMHGYGIPDSTFIMYVNPPAVGQVHFCV